MDPREQAAVFDFRELWRADSSAERKRPLSEYLARFPGYDAAIAVEWVRLTGEEREVRDLVPAPGVSLVPEPADEQRLGPYRLVRTLGRGGQGVVYLAEDTRLQGRIVALKALDRTALGLSNARIRRLRFEAEALARLDHPGICGIHEAQLDGERPFLAMRYVRGRTLQAVLAEGTGVPRSTEALHRVLQWIERTALAVHAAHEAGIVHRDIKPANVMIDSDGLPVLLDFGLARDENPDSLALTLSGEVFGTLAYMAPEQIAGGRGLDRRVDVYALGVTLYECLARAQPFAGPTREAVTDRIKTGRCRDLRALNPAVSHDLAVVVAKAMEPERERRYASARALADDLACVRERRPILARPAGLTLRAVRWTQRHPVAAAMLCVLTVALAAVSVLLLYMRLQTRELQAWKRANTVLSLAATDPGRALDRAVEAATDQAHYEIRSALHDVLNVNWQTYEVPQGNPLDAGSGLTTPPVLLGDGATLAGVTNAGELLLLDLADGSLRAAFAGAHGAQGMAAAVSHDGRALLTADLGGRVSLWDACALLEGELSGQSWSADPRVVTCAAAARGADLFFVGGADQRLQCFASAGGAYRELAVPADAIDGRTVAELWPDPGGRQLLMHVRAEVGVGAIERGLLLIDVATGGVVHEAPFPTSHGIEAEWSPSGDRFAFVEQAGTLCVLDAQGRSGWRTDERSYLNNVHFSLDGTLLLTFGARGLTVWDADTGQVLKREASATGRSFEDGWLSPDGRMLAVAIRDSTLHLYDTASWSKKAYLAHQATGYGRYGLWSLGGSLAVFDHATIQGFDLGFRAHLPVLGDHGGSVVSLAFHPNGELLASAAEDGWVRIWDLRGGSVRRELLCDKAPVRVRAGVDQLLVATAEPVARLWPWSPQGSAIELRGHLGPVTDAWFLAEDQRVLTLGEDGTARLWSTNDGGQLRSFEAGRHPLRTAAFDEGADLLAVAGDEPAVEVFELTSGRHLRRLVSPETGAPGFVGRPRYLHFDSVNSRLYAAAEGSGGVACWDIERDWAYSELYGMSAGSSGWAVTDDGGRWLICCENALGTTRWFDAASHAPLPWDPAWEPGTMINRVQFTRTGALALLASYDGTVRLFDMLNLRPWSVLRAEHGGAMDACFSPDGTSLAVGYKDGAVLVWPTDPLPVAREHRVRRSVR